MAGLILLTSMRFQQGRFQRGLLLVATMQLFFVRFSHAEEALLGIQGAPGQTDPSSSFSRDETFDQEGHDIGPGRLIPGMKLKLLYTDNVTRTDTGTTDSFGTVVSPRVAYIISDYTKNFIIDYTIEQGLYISSTDDNYLDHYIRSGFSYQPTARIFSEINADLKFVHDARGTGRAEAVGAVTQDSIDKWHQWGLNGRFAYGRPNAIGRLELEADYFQKRYDTNRAFTASRDRDALSGQARFNYRVRPKTFLSIEGKATDNSYKFIPAGTASLDSIDTTYLAGVRWEATFKTTGFAKIGYNFKNFESDQRNDTSGLAWEMGVDWRPKTYSTVRLETSQRFDETNGTGDAIDQTFYLVNWEHFWLPRFSTRMNAGYQNQTFDPTTREDDFYNVGISANYDFRRWLAVSASYDYSILNSNVNTFDYQENRFELTFEAEF